jgi:translation initiation factor 2 subunit 3
MSEKKEVLPELNIGLVGHVDHGKTTLTQALSGKWADTHSEEIKRGITIRLGYANTTVYKCPECKDPECYSTSKKCPNCKTKGIPLRNISLIDAPGHETLMATMLSGAAIMDAALLMISANEECPQPQTKEHLMALEISGIKDIIIVQNKIDLVPEEQVLENYKQIKEFVKGTIAENVPIIPISAQQNINVDVLIKTIQENFKSKELDTTKDPIFLIARSFDINKPGSLIKNMNGGVLGGSLKQGLLKIGEKIELRPGIKTEKDGKISWEPVKTKIVGLEKGGKQLKELTPGGSSGILTELDPSIVKSDSLVGNLAGLEDKVPKVWHEITLKPTLLERVVGSKSDLKTEDIKINENLMLNINATVTVGMVTSATKDAVKVKLKVPICAKEKDRITISRLIGSRWRLIGYSEIV